MKVLVPHEWRHYGVARVTGEKAGPDGDVDACPPTEAEDGGTPPSSDDSRTRAREPECERSDERGITVVELMVVMAIIAIIMGLGAYSLGRITNTDLRSDANRLASAMKYTYANAAINNTEYRMVFDLDSGVYHTEIASEPVVEQAPASTDNTEDFLTEEAQRLADKVEEESDLFADEEENPFGVNRKVTYERVQDGVLKKMKMSSGNRIARFVKAGVEDEYVEGKVSVTFFPNGFQEQVMIVLRSGDGEDGAAYTLISEPLTGSVRTFSKELEIPDEFGAVEEDE